MTLKYNRTKIAKEMLKAMELGKADFKEYVVEMLLEISQELRALERILAKKRVLHPKEINTELQRVQKGLVKKYNKTKKEFERIYKK